ncbi:MAG: hypothetical protein AB8B91_14970 [Rubripirellula sp.]
MKRQTSTGAAIDNNTSPMACPHSIQVIRILGKGRAAQARLVDATMPDGRVVRCVEKVFAPGRLTRTLYRLSFQAPFGYQTNRDAILACFFRRRVASAVLAASDTEASIAEPIYVRYDEEDRAWVLAAEWIDGRGIKPAEVDATRIRRWVRGYGVPASTEPAEISQLVETMHGLEDILGECGLVGSGWQVAPRAMVSTANLLRTGDRYTVIDLESGIPAVLVPRYLMAGLKRAALPPFDDLDANQLRDWLTTNERLLLFRIGPERLEQLKKDTVQLLDHTERWKNSEFAIFRRPWRLLTPSGIQAYQRECFRRWEQDRILDANGAEAIERRPIQSRLIWCADSMPTSLGRFCARLIGRASYRQELLKCLRSSESRVNNWQTLVAKRKAGWIEAERLRPEAKLTTLKFAAHSILSKLTPVRLHRFLSDPRQRRDVFTTFVLLLCSPRFQAWFGQKRIAASIDRWESSERISPQAATELRRDLSGHEVRAYTRGFGMHLALKALAPVVVPAKVGGVAAFFASGNLWFLLPMLATPLMRSAVTMANWWTTRREQVPHGEALLAGLLPFVGSVAFPLQMFSTRPKLSTFLIRDTASKVGRRIPIYGGADSRTEMAVIRWSDYLVEFMQCTSAALQKLYGKKTMESSTPDIQVSLPIRARTRLGRWIDRQVSERIKSSEKILSRETIEQRAPKRIKKAA